MAFAGSNAIVAALTARDTESSDLGQYFVAVNPTPGTGIASAAAPTTLVETTPLLTIFNNGNATVYLMYLRLTITAGSTGGTAVNYTHSLDSGNRYSSGGTALTISNVNGGNTNGSNAVLTYGAVTATAKSSKQRNLGNLIIRPSVIDQTGDKYEIQYGEGSSGSVTPFNGTNPGYFVVPAPPVVIQPQWTYLVNLWKTSMSAAQSAEVEIAYVEK